VRQYRTIEIAEFPKYQEWPKEYYEDCKEEFHEIMHMWKEFDIYDKYLGYIRVLALKHYG
jgi:hypothetical protein